VSTPTTHSLCRRPDSSGTTPAHITDGHKRVHSSVVRPERQPALWWAGATVAAAHRRQPGLPARDACRQLAMLSPIVVLYRPAIAGNVGSIARTCRGWRIPLHIVGPTSLALDGTDVHRAAVGYTKGETPGVETVDRASFVLFADLADWHERCGPAVPLRNRFLLTKRGSLPLQAVTAAVPRGPDQRTAIPVALLFGNETCGLEESLPGRSALLSSQGWRGVAIPMPSGDLRCHNLAVSVAMALWEVCRTWSDAPSHDSPQPLA